MGLGLGLTIVMKPVKYNISFYISSRFYNFRRQFAERFSWSSIVLNCAT